MRQLQNYRAWLQEKEYGEATVQKCIRTLKRFF